ncbi:MAG: hypothetical protein D6812_02900 [Deltaproteobacteria bacterium]|nr:MAG: hypothetical protein D6812_02900 [Deltaproteobacteria bacterium]
MQIPHTHTAALAFTHHRIPSDTPSSPYTPDKRNTVVYIRPDHTLVIHGDCGRGVLLGGTVDFLRSLQDLLHQHLNPPTTGRPATEPPPPPPPFPEANP